MTRSAANVFDIQGAAKTAGTQASEFSWDRQEPQSLRAYEEHRAEYREERHGSRKQEIEAARKLVAVTTDTASEHHGSVIDHGTVIAHKSLASHPKVSEKMLKGLTAGQLPKKNLGSHFTYPSKSFSVWCRKRFVQSQKNRMAGGIIHHQSSIMFLKRPRLTL
jgi:hypothetical protein